MLSRRVVRLFGVGVLILALASLAGMALAQSGDVGEVGPITVPAGDSGSLFQNFSLGQDFVNEQEPNNSSGEATPLGGTNVVALGSVYPNADVDYYSFTAAAGDKVYAATMTSFSANGSSDSQLNVIGTDGTTVIEFDDDNGSFGGLSSTIAGATLPSAGTYYIRVNHFSLTSQLRPYHLHVQVRSGSPTAETEPNDASPGQPLPPSGWVSGSTSATTDVDIFSLALNAGDTVYVSLDLDPERDTVEWNGQVGLAPFNNFFLVANDAGTDTPDSEAFFMTVQSAGTYFVLVNVPTGGTTFGTYELSVSVQPAAAQNCTTYTSTNVPQTIPDGPGMVSSTITVPGSAIIGDLNVSIDLTHANMPDLDVHLVSPEGNDNGLFTDNGSSTQTPMNLTLDDEAGVPMGLYTVVSGMVFQPELAYRLDWFDGEDAAGTWTLVLRDDTAANGGTLNNWSITVCEPPPAPMCPGGSQPIIVYSSDFEANDGGFTHSGTADEWEWGLPTFVPIDSCNSGTGCWKTDLDNTYDINSDQNLLSPSIDLTSYSGTAWVSWSRKYHMESASFDHAFFDVQQTGGASPRRVWEWMDATMTSSVGSPTVTIEESAGWGTFYEDISDFAGQNVELRFHLDSEGSVNKAGLAVDDITVTACESVGPTETPTATPIATSTATNTPQATATSTATNTPEPTASSTATTVPGPSETPTSTSEPPAPTATATQGPTNVSVTDVSGQNSGSGFLAVAVVVIGAALAGLFVYQRRQNG
jgi:subtilisin-like proprotein convertase family protein